MENICLEKFVLRCMGKEKVREKACVRYQVSEPSGEKFKDKSQQDRLFLLMGISS